MEAGGVKTKYQMIELASADFAVTEMCVLLNICRSGYYAYRERKGIHKNRVIKEHIQAVYTQREGTYGYRRIQAELKRQYDETVNHKKVFDLMRELGLQAVIRRKRHHRSPYQVAQSDGRVAENLLKRDFTAQKPNEKWVTDITQYKVNDERLYLSAIKDLGTSEIIAYRIGSHNDNELVLSTFKDAIEAQKDATDDPRTDRSQ